MPRARGERVLKCFGLVALAWGLVGCPRDETCTSDEECPVAGSRCDVATNRCVCVTDAACAEGEFCNSAGSCQKSFCRSNDDCMESGTVCEAGSGRCVMGPGLQIGSPCSAAGQCPFGSICVDRRCVPGCFGHGDCLLGQLCVDGQCRAENGACEASTRCPYGSLCDQGMCRADTRGLYCAACPTATPENRSPCGPPGSLCLVNSRGAGPDEYCGVDCSQGQACPNGYFCSGISTLTDRECVRDEECDGNRRCVIGEGRTFGFCSCATDADCPADRCHDELRICEWSGADCDPEGQPCGAIQCQNGACIIGRNCVPLEGFDCDVLTRR